MEADVRSDRPPMLNIDVLVERIKKRHFDILKNMEGFLPLQATPSLRELSSPLPTSKPPDPMPPSYSYAPTMVAVQNTIPLDLVVTRDYTIACKIRDIIVTKTEFSFMRRIKMAARVVDVIHFCITWGDLHADELDAHSNLLVNLGDLLECGLSVTDLRTLGLASTYAQLKSVLYFSPVDLCVSYRLFNLSHLAQHYGITFNNLLFDFRLGMIDYFVKLNLSLENIASFGINIEIAMQWRKFYNKAFSDANMTPPILGGGVSSQASASLLPLDRSMLQQRYEKRLALFEEEEDRLRRSGDSESKRDSRRKAFDHPKNWNLFMGLELAHLYAMKVTLKDIETWWLKPHNITLDELLNSVFGCTDEVLLRYYKNSPVEVKTCKTEKPKKSTSPPSLPNNYASTKTKNKKKEKKAKNKKSTKKPQAKARPVTSSSSTPPISIASMRASLSEQFVANDISSSTSDDDDDSSSSESSNAYQSFSSSSSSDGDGRYDRSPSLNSRSWQNNIPNVLDKY